MSPSSIRRCAPAREAVSRRAFLAGAGAGLLATLGDSRCAAVPVPAPERRVIVVVLGGGVRASDALGPTGPMPRLRSLADAGVTHAVCRAGATDRLGARHALLTGVRWKDATAVPSRPSVPTVFEYVRRQNKLGADDAWLVLSGRRPDAPLDWSTHTDFGADYGASVVRPDLAAGKELSRLVHGLDVKTASSGTLRAKVAERLAAAHARPGAGPSLRPATVEALETALLAELEKGKEPGDPRTLRVARHIVTTVHPRLLVAVLDDAHVAEKSFADYGKALQQADAGIGALWDAVQADGELRKTTSIIVVPDLGRDKRRNARGGLGQDPKSRTVSSVFLVAAGNGFREKTKPRPAAQAVDVTPTVCHLLGAKASHAKGRLLKAALV